MKTKKYINPEEVVKRLEFAFLWYVSGEDNSWRVKHNWELFKEPLEQILSELPENEA